MVEDETENAPTDVGSHPVLSSSWNEKPVALGEQPQSPISKIADQMDELAGLLREFAARAETESRKIEDPLGKQKMYDAHKCLLKAVDRIQRYVNEYR